jgi:hypothetical protein
MSKHTPGPWSTSGDGLVYGPPTTDDEATLICDTAGEEWMGPNSEEKANARLIAAAPTLAAALRWALDQIEDDLDPDHQATLAAARTVLAEATREGA